MNLNDYRVRILDGACFELVHLPTGRSLLVTQDVGLDTLMRLALNHDFRSVK